MTSFGTTDTTEEAIKTEDRNSENIRFDEDANNQMELEFSVIIEDRAKRRTSTI